MRFSSEFKRVFELNLLIDFIIFVFDGLPTIIKNKAEFVDLYYAWMSLVNFILGLIFLKYLQNHYYIIPLKKNENYIIYLSCMTLCYTMGYTILISTFKECLAIVIRRFIEKKAWIVFGFLMLGPIFTGIAWIMENNYNNKQTIIELQHQINQQNTTEIPYEAINELPSPSNETNANIAIV